MVLRLLLVVLLASAAPAAARTYALLVGVGEYTHLDADLRGPPNDAALMAQVLIERGLEPADILVLTTAPDRLGQALATELPTRYAILGALDALAEKTGEGDTVIFYFSGHGAQTPDLDGDDQGGYDEILLPMDAKGWNGSIGAVENALLDDTLREKARAILSDGTALVSIIDACHAATGFRALPGVGAVRYVDPVTLGLPQAQEPVALRPATALSGDFAFLYSAQSDQRAFEYPLGDADNPANWYGDFTRVLAEVLRAAPDLTWAQALSATTDGMRKNSATATQTPDGEGPLLNAAVPGGNIGGTLRLPVVDGELQRGLLSGVTPGSKVTIYAGALGGDPIGTGEITEVQPSRARFSDFVPDGYAQITFRAPPSESALKIGTPQGPNPLDTNDYTALRAALETWTRPSDSPDYTPVFTDGTLAFVGPDGVLDPAGSGSSPRLKDTPLPDMLDRLSRVKRLYRALALAAPAGFAAPSAMVVEMERRGSDLEAGECNLQTATSERPYNPNRSASHCDQLWLHLHNQSSTAQDVTVLLVDRDLKITPVWPPVGQSNRFNFNEKTAMGFRLVNPGTAVSVEELVVLVAPAEPGAPRTVLTDLAEDGQTRGQQSALAAFLAEAIAPPDTRSRGFSVLGPPSPLKTYRFPFRLLPGDPPISK